MAAARLAAHVQLEKWMASTLRGSKPPLIKAVAAKMCGAQQHAVLDLTGGLCKDAIILASHGAHVVALERNPVVFGEVAKALDDMAAAGGRGGCGAGAAGGPLISNQLQLAQYGGSLQIVLADAQVVLRALQQTAWGALAAGRQKIPQSRGRNDDISAANVAVSLDHNGGQRRPEAKTIEQGAHDHPTDGNGFTGVAGAVQAVLREFFAPTIAARTLYMDPMHQPRRKKSALVKQVRGCTPHNPCESPCRAITERPRHRAVGART